MPKIESIAAGWRMLNVFRRTRDDWLRLFFQKPLLLHGKRVARNAIRPWLVRWRGSAHICCGAALGDALICAPAIRALKQANPRCRVHFYTDYPDVVRG
jgi:hypothetical protein